MQQALSKVTPSEGLVLQSAEPTFAIAAGFPSGRGGDRQRVALIFLAIVIAHLLAIEWLVTRTTEYTPLNLVTPQESTTIQASVVEYSEPPAQVVEQTPVLTADSGDREVQQVVNQPPAPETPSVAKKTVIQTPPPKLVVKKTPEAKPVAHKPVTAKVPTAKPQPAAPEVTTSSPGQGVPIAGSSAGRMMQNSSSAQPKNVASIGCTVPEPNYPRRAQRLKQQGEVLVRLVINPQGQLTRYEVARSSGFDALDQAALAAVQKIRCTPYIQDGQPIAVMTLQPVNFRLAH